MAMRAEVQFIEAFADRCPAVDLDGELDEDFYPG